jgi:methyltransferase (TIGR00027 family)
MASNVTKDDMDTEVDNFTNDSAMMIAYERALETERPDSLIQDPFAKLLQGTKGQALSEDFDQKCTMFGFEGWPEFHKMWTAVRTKFIDDQLSKATADISQLVNVGAGLDTRSFRLDCYRNLKSVFEVDMAVINEAKSKILDKLGATPLCAKFEIVSIDLLDAEQSLRKELVAKGFDDKKPTVFVAEGLIMYLGDGAWKFLTDVIDLSCDGSVFVLNFMDGGAHTPTGPSEARLREHFGASWEFEFYKYGEDGLNFGRYDTAKFPPSAAFSFMVARKKCS